MKIHPNFENYGTAMQAIAYVDEFLLAPDMVTAGYDKEAALAHIQQELAKTGVSGAILETALSEADARWEQISETYFNDSF